MNERPFFVLLIDDDPHTRNMFQLVMDYHQITLAVAENAEDGLDMLGHAPQPDIIVMDLFLPQTDGFRALQQIREQGLAPDVPVIATTAYHTYTTPHEVAEWGFAGYLPKPLETNQLVNYLKSIAGWGE